MNLYIIGDLDKLVSEISYSAIIIDYVRYYTWSENQQNIPNKLKVTESDAGDICKVIKNDINPDKRQYSFPYIMTGFYSVLIILVIIILFYIFKRVKTKLGNENPNSNVQTNDDNIDGNSLHIYTEYNLEYCAQDNTSYVQNNEYITIE